MMMRKIVKEGIAAEIPYRWIALGRGIRKPHLKIMTSLCAQFCASWLTSSENADRIECRAGQYRNAIYMKNAEMLVMLLRT
jgi:hypothetical protein